MNTILICCDTWRRDHSGAYGNDWINTPNINAFAEKSAVFENAFIGSYPTLPCRRDIQTGRYEFPWRGWGGLEQDDVTLSGQFTAAQKISYLFTDIYHHWGRDAGSIWKDFGGFDLVRGQERDFYVTDSDIQFEHRALDYPEHNKKDHGHFRNCQLIRHEESDWFSPQLFSRAARWIQHNADHEDFFLMIDAFDPHEPWDPPRYYIDMYDDPDYDGRDIVVAPYGPVKDNLTPEELKHIQAQYAGEVTMIDRWFGHFIDQVDALGLMDETMIILTTDHGTHNGDHGRTGKNWVLWDEISHIPLMVWHPEMGHGARPKQFVQPIDYFPTICEVGSVETPDGLHGRSLLPYLDDPDGDDPRDAILFGEFRNTCNITDGEYTLFQGVDPSHPPLYSYTNILSKWNSGDWGPFDGVRRRVGPKNSNNSGGKNETRFYHNATDPKQENNIRDSAPEQLLRMRKLMSEKLQAIDAPTELLARFGLDKI